MLEKVKKFREKKVEVEPEPQEDKKPSELCVIHVNGGLLDRAALSQPQKLKPAF